MKYRYIGPVPVTDEAGELVHPLDVREFDEAPDCPPWEPVDEPGGIESEADPADVPEPQPERPPMSYTPVIGGKTIVDMVVGPDFAAAPPATPKGM